MLFCTFNAPWISLTEILGMPRMFALCTLRNGSCSSRCFDNNSRAHSFNLYISLLPSFCFKSTKNIGRGSLVRFCLTFQTLTTSCPNCSMFCLIPSVSVEA
ncbi:hypothetical protein HUJ04_011775 [Dendroctonus ponderosae]|nr:hypothetical protein HUJ04_011775 [Dendroctonus ponderosae]